MKRFRSPLDKLDRWRNQQERQARRGLATALSAVAVLERREAALREGLAACEGEAASQAAGLARAIARGIEQRRIQVLCEQRAAQTQVVQAREAFHRARADAEAVRRLLSVRREQWRADCLAVEQREIEETSRRRPPQPRKDQT